MFATDPYSSVTLNLGSVSSYLTLGKLFNLPEAEFLPLQEKNGGPPPPEFIELH